MPGRSTMTAPMQFLCASLRGAAWKLAGVLLTRLGAERGGRPGDARSPLEDIGDHIPSGRDRFVGRRGFFMNQFKDF